MGKRDSPERSADGVVPGRAASLATLLGPPSSLLARVRWLFLLLATGAIGSLLVRVAGHSDRAAPVRLLVFTLLAGLVMYWRRGYLRSRFPPRWLPWELLALATSALGANHPVMGVGVVYSAVAFRASYSSWRQAIGYIAAAVSSYLLGVLLAARLGQIDIALAL